MRVGAIIQARMTSNRLPGKVLLDLDGKPVLQRIIERVREAETLDDIIVATTKNDADIPIKELCATLGCKCYTGLEDDVLSRVLKAAKHYALDIIVEITADCPLIDPTHINHLVNMYDNGYTMDMVSNIKKRSFPRGYDIRVFATAILERVNFEVDNPIDRQHVSTWMYLNPKSQHNYLSANWLAPNDVKRPDLDITLDTPADYELIKWLYVVGRVYNLKLTCAEVINLINTHPDKYAKVAKVRRKSYMDELQTYYAEAKYA